MTNTASPSAPAISRLLKSKFGIITLPDFRREGYRVTGNKDLGSVRIYVAFDLPEAQARRTEELATALIDLGFDLTTDNAGIILHKKGIR